MRTLGLIMNVERVHSTSSCVLLPLVSTDDTNMIFLTLWLRFPQASTSIFHTPHCDREPRFSGARTRHRQQTERQTNRNSSRLTRKSATMPASQAGPTGQSNNKEAMPGHVDRAHKSEKQDDTEQHSAPTHTAVCHNEQTATWLRQDSGWGENDRGTLH